MLSQYVFWFYCLLRMSRQPPPQRMGTCIPRSKGISPRLLAHPDTVVCVRAHYNTFRGDSARSVCCARQSRPPDDRRRPAKVRLLRSVPRPGDYLVALWATCLAWATLLCLGIGPVVRSTLLQHGVSSSQSQACGAVTE